MPFPRDAIPAPLVGHVASLDVPPPRPLPSTFFDAPMTDLCRKAYKFVLEFLPGWAANHSFRTYAFALAIAHYAGWDEGEKAERFGFDKEQIWLACALHELGFDQKHAVHSRLSLEIWSGIKAREWILDQREDFVSSPTNRSLQDLVDYADEACEAIARHTIEFRGFSRRVRLTGALVALGSGQDLMGLSSASIHPDTIRVICERWPRIGYCDGLREVAKREVQKPACLFEDCVEAFDPGMYDVEAYRGMQGELKDDRSQSA